MRDTKTRTKRKIGLLLLVVALTLFNLVFIFNSSMWGDELYTYRLLGLDMGNMMHEIVNDVHPPLYYFICRVLTSIFGLSVPLLKVVSIIPTTLTMLIAVLVIDKDIFLQKGIGTVLFLLFIGTSERSVTFSLELRMYSWSMFFCFSSAVWAYKYFKNKSKKDLVFLILFSLGAAYSHYFALICVAFIYLFLFIALFVEDRKNLKRIFVISLVTIVGYAPWLPVFYAQATFISKDKDFWIQAIDSLSCFNFPFSGEYQSFTEVFFVFLCVTAIFELKKRRRDSSFIFSLLCIVTFACIPLSGIILSKLIRPIFLSRYMYVGIAVLFFAIAYLAATVKKGRYSLVLLALIVIQIPFTFRTVKVKEYGNGTSSTVNFIEKNIADVDVIVTDIRHPAVLSFYAGERDIEKVDSFEDLKQQENLTYWYFSKDNLDGMAPVYKGNIDNNYYFSVYKLSSSEGEASNTP